MSWHSPFVTRTRSVGQGLQRGLEFGRSLEASGIEPDSDEWREAVHRYLGTETDSYCRCGRKLKIFELGGETCYECTQADEQRLEGNFDSRELRMQKLGVPASYAHCTLEAFRGKIPDDLAGWIAKPSLTLTIFGASPGTGKTHLATAALYSLTSGGRHGFWLSSIVLAKRLSEEIFNDKKETDQRSSRTPFLLIDDYGREDGVVPKARELVSAIGDVRYQNNRPTIYTTNLVHLDSNGEIVADKLIAYNAAMASRILSGALVPREGEDERWK